eukprot:1197971-Amorphochlora_amoeboformis.AAC.2
MSEMGLQACPMNTIEAITRYILSGNTTRCAYPDAGNKSKRLRKSYTSRTQFQWYGTLYSLSFTPK